MGQLAFPDSAHVYIDTVTVIYAVETYFRASHATYHQSNVRQEEANTHLRIQEINF